MSSKIIESDVLTEVPTSLKRLARMTVRGFYGIDYAIVIDMLVRNPCMKEEDLENLLKFERKQLRSVIASLKNDKFVKVRLRVETQPDGKTSKHNYYFINYRLLVNVIKYKLDHIRRKIETEERDSNNCGAYKCPNCLKTFTDFDARDLMDFTTGYLQCTHCNTEVVEDESGHTMKDTRTLLARFNEQIEPIYNLLRDVEDIKLAPEILEPEPTDISHITRRLEGGHRQPGENTGWSGDATRGVDYNMMKQDITINMADNNKPVTSEKKEKKERPVWMVASTVQGSFSEQSVPASEMLSSLMAEEDTSAQPNKNNHDIMRALLAHEKKSGVKVNIPTANSSEEGETSESEEEVIKPTFMDVDQMDSDDDDDDDTVPIVTIGDKRIPLSEVTDEILSQMTPAEKEAYIKLGQEAYARIHE